MPTPKIPIRPKKGKYQLTNEEMDCLAWYVISGCKKEHAFKTFVRPDLVVSPMVLGKETKKFFDLIEVRNFLSDYTRMLNGESVEPTKQKQAKTPEEAAAYAVGKFKGKVYDAMIDAEGLEELDTAAKLGDRVGAFDNEKAAEIAPQRYIHESCFRCRYKIFCEQNIKDGNIIDCCQYCVALEYAREHGFIYDPTKLLDLPFTEYTEDKNTNKAIDDESN